MTMTEYDAFKQMSPERRNLYFRIINDEDNFHPITLRLLYLDMHFPLEKLDTALAWLINQSLVGQKFIHFFETTCVKSDLELHRLLLSIVDNLKLAPIIAGKNFRS